MIRLRLVQGNHQRGKTENKSKFKKDKRTKTKVKKTRGDYKSKANAAAASYAKQRDPLDEIEVYKMSGNKFEINHPMNSSGRDLSQKRGGKLMCQKLQRRS